MFHNLTTLVATLFTATLAGCGGVTDSAGSTEGAVTNTGVGDPCVTEDEARPGFSGFSAMEVNIESQSVSCETGICLAYDFAGRVGCPYGGSDCPTTGSPSVPVTVEVPPQLVDRPPSSAVYCSCRCEGAAGTGPLCACPSGFSCEPIVAELGSPGDNSWAGSYCLKNGTKVLDPIALASGARCDAALANCGGR
jgi:hypothetical protein